MTTITEALAEIKTTGKRIEKARKFVLDHLFLQGLDPLADDGGTKNLVEGYMQRIRDFEKNIVAYRTAINKVNMVTTLEIQGEAKTVAQWLIWRRDVEGGHKKFLDQIAASISDVRSQALQKQLNMTDGAVNKPQDIGVNVSEKWLQDVIDQNVLVMGELDGRLSLANATTEILVEEFKVVE